jgi:membrane protein implicated in regulation of membrane protease activity
MTGSRSEIPTSNGAEAMLIVGLILLLLGIFLNVGILTTIGIILLVVGAILWILGAVGRPIAGRRYWY